MKLPKVKASSPKEAINSVLSLLKEDKPWFAYVDLDVADQAEENYTKSLAEIDQQIDDTLASVSLDNTIVIITQSMVKRLINWMKKHKKTISVVMKSKCVYCLLERFASTRSDKFNKPYRFIASIDVIDL